ncbi:MAG TPA: alanine--glyoxylate aminotransferase family protein, partial [Nodosilinea sp.]|nr:alanine--glyoxylate aminotransferase family protein [Nodosilinea sp.]
MATTLSPNIPVRLAPPAALDPLVVPKRLLLGPGPSNADPRVIAALNQQPIGHLDTAYLTMMDEVQELLRYTWQTTNPLTYAVAG